MPSECTPLCAIESDPPLPPPGAGQAPGEIEVEAPERTYRFRCACPGGAGEVRSPRLGPALRRTRLGGGPRRSGTRAAPQVGRDHARAAAEVWIQAIARALPGRPAAPQLARASFGGGPV